MNIKEKDIKKKIIDMLYVYNGSTGLSIQAIDKDGNVISQHGEFTRFCKMFKDFTKDYCPCSDTHLYNSRLAMNFGESYIFLCPAQLVLITCPLVIDNRFSGAVLTGPLLMSYPDKLLVDEIIQNNNLDISATGKIISYLNSVPVVEPSKVNALSKLLAVLTNNITSEIIDSNEIKEKFRQQSRINENIQLWKNEESNNSESYPYEKEKDLYVKVKNGNTSEARAILNELLGYVFFKAGGISEVIKTRALELCSILSRAAVEGGADLKTVFGINDKYIHKIITSKNLDDLTYSVQKVLDSFSENVLKIGESKNVMALRKSIQYINDNFHNHITLEDIADHVHLSPTYFSSIFKNGTGFSISDYINNVRVEESKRLLTNTEFSIIDIAIAVGFADQSYFTKVFKKFIGITPKQFRNLNSQL